MAHESCSDSVEVVAVIGVPSDDLLTAKMNCKIMVNAMIIAETMIIVLGNNLKSISAEAELVNTVLLDWRMKKSTTDYKRGEYGREGKEEATITSNEFMGCREGSHMMHFEVWYGL